MAPGSGKSENAIKLKLVDVCKQYWVRKKNKENNFKTQGYHTVREGEKCIKCKLEKNTLIEELPRRKDIVIFKDRQQ